MDSFILDDVNELIKSKKGDSSRLVRIKEACESNEIISISDRKYIERLTSQYLRIPEEEKSRSQEKPKFIPVEEFEEKTEKQIPNTEQFQLEKPEFVKEQEFFKESEKERSSKAPVNLLNKKIIMAIGAIALAIILIGVTSVGFDGIEFQVNSGKQNNVLPDFSLDTDKTSYETADIISISGKISSSSTGIIKLSIENEKNELIWVEELQLKNNGEFSTLLIAGGQGWENNGKYFLNVEHNDYSSSISFDFKAK